MSKFCQLINSKEVQDLCSKAQHFQNTTVQKWNPNVNELTLSFFFGLVGIDESVSKECGALTLDLLLRAGVLVENKDGSWSLAKDYKERRIYLVGDAKTIENIVKVVRDMQDRKKNLFRC